VSGSPYLDLDRPPLREIALRKALLRPGGFVSDLRVVASTGSTNADLAALARQGAPAGTVLVAEHQTSGRGRLDRRWTAPPRSALTFSVLLRPRDVPPTRWPWLPLLVGCAVVEAVRLTTKQDAKLKWPNDVLLNGKKLAGILVERSDEAAIVGIGLNVSLRAEELPTDTATSLTAEAGDEAEIDRDPLLRAILRALGALTEAWQDAAGDPVGLRESYKARCATLGRRVRILLPDRTVEGKATDVDTDGRLVVELDNGDKKEFGAGDVVHVR
jgi:BirA family biotin operon repressor/biotin-[acetyl-CoA-carboxylase] ligase